ncbi:hypothetical protein JG687_00008936 [Phytophthora cactorum]|uniref:P-loop containing nucleoside triphosphate hydrolase n=1 Tax=Phytophthora cactorum TaxID=29920 RepID=A0A8T1UG32_9STRA|nr:hypothetical protein JG687_00008936 [Phytophthora cactorum]
MKFTLNQLQTRMEKTSAPGQFLLLCDVARENVNELKIDLLLFMVRTRRYGVLAYEILAIAATDYHYSSTYDTKILPPRMQRPRRLYVQAPTTGNTSGRRSFDFDFIFPPWTKQREVYDKCTGTGKTYTMGMLSDFTDDKEQGLIPRALSQILEFAGNVEGEEDMRKTLCLDARLGGSHMLDMALHLVAIFQFVKDVMEHSTSPI